MFGLPTGLDLGRRRLMDREQTVLGGGQLGWKVLADRDPAGVAGVVVVEGRAIEPDDGT